MRLPPALRHAPATLGYLILTAAYSWPFPIHPATRMPGPMGGDVSASIQKFRVLESEGKSAFATEVVHTVGWPTGVRLSPGVDIVSFLSSGFLELATKVIGSVAAHGLLGVLGYMLTSLVTYLFVTEVTGSRNAGFLAGAVFAFSTHMVLVIWSATTYTWMGLLLLPLWAVWRLAQVPGVRRALLAGAAYLPALFWTPYFALHAFAVAASALVVFLVLRGSPAVRLARRFGLGAIAGGIWALGLGTYAVLGHSYRDQVPVRAVEDRFEQAAHPLMYVTPGSWSWLWGDGLARSLAERVPRAAGVNIYLGVSVLLLGAIGLVGVLLGSRRADARDAMRPIAVASVMAATAALVCFAFSLPPRLLHSRVPAPSSLIFAVEPALRAGQRFVMPLMVGTSVLAGLGLYILLRRLHLRPVLAVGVTLLLTAVALADTRVTPTGAWEQVPGPSRALAALRREPPGPAMHYVFSGALDSPAPRPCFLQGQHGKVLANGCQLQFDRAPGFIRWLDLEICAGLREERRAGVRYVIADPERPEVLRCFERGRAGRYRLIGRDPGGLVAIAFR